MLDQKCAKRSASFLFFFLPSFCPFFFPVCDRDGRALDSRRKKDVVEAPDVIGTLAQSDAKGRCGPQREAEVRNGEKGGRRDEMGLASQATRRGVRVANLQRSRASCHGALGKCAGMRSEHQLMNN